MKSLCNPTQGLDLVEYALAAGMIAVTAMAATPALRTVVNNMLSYMGSR